MSFFVEQEDVFKVVETLMIKLFREFSNKNILKENFQEFHLRKLLKNMVQISQI